MLLTAGHEVPGRIGTQRGVDGIADVEVGLVGTTLGAEVIVKTGAHVEGTPGTKGKGHVLVVTTKTGYKARRDGFNERETVGVTGNGGQEACIGNNAAGSAQRDAVDTAVTTVQVPHQDGWYTCVTGHTRGGIDRRPAVNAATLAAGAAHDVAVEEATRHCPLGVVTKGVQLQCVADFKSGIDEDLGIVFHIRLAPVLRHFAGVGVDHLVIGHRCVAIGFGKGDVVPDDGANGPFNVSDLTGDVDETTVTQRQAQVGGDVVVVTIALVGGAIAGHDLETFSIITQNKVKYPGNSVGSVL